MGRRSTSIVSSDETHHAGDHLIFIGEVVALNLDPEASPLLFHGGSYAQLHDV